MGRTSTRKKPNGGGDKPRFDAAEAITREIVDILKTGTMPWRKPWVGGGDPLPLRQCGERYRGINSFLLSMRALMAGHSSPYWMTFNQARAMDACVRKGERSSLVVYYGQSYRKAEAGAEISGGEIESDDHGDAEDRSFRFLKAYRVFNACQIDGLEARFFPEPEARDLPGSTEIPRLEAFFAAIGADVVRTGTRACYVPAIDRIYMPEIARFADAEKFYATLAHEHVHWTKRADRLDRSFADASFGNGAYAQEELVAEIGSALLCRQLGLSPHHIDDTSSYIASWIKVLNSDHRFIFKAGAHAQRAVDFLTERATATGAHPLPIAA